MRYSPNEKNSKKIHSPPVGAAEGCDLLILIFTMSAEEQDQKIAAFGSSYGGSSLLSGVGQA
ncbi:hypothetical protein [Pseudomonas sp. A-RE-19]|uniref:hypothetical protein n=1 Tax=Pseudomonas sp. A-RE-19 TaxID=2832401 RepID=UPI001CBF0CBC|nr:hypothetical protein [Pseudomonas sp. A-RE-19]